MRSAADDRGRVLDTLSPHGPVGRPRSGSRKLVDGLGEMPYGGSALTFRGKSLMRESSLRYGGEAFTRSTSRETQDEFRGADTRRNMPPGSRCILSMREGRHRC
jgi:hypothetical protein